MKSFVSNFPQKKSNHRCTRAFEVCLLEPQPDLETKEGVEVYVMGIKKSKRGALQGEKIVQGFWYGYVGRRISIG